MMTVETAEALILVTMDSIAHRQNCLSETVLDTELPRELLLEALGVLEAEGRGADAQAIRQWFTSYGIHLPATPEAKALDRVSGKILAYLSQSDAAQTREAIEASIRGKTDHKRVALQNLCTNGKIVKTGAGCKGSPFLYDLRGKQSQKPA